MSVHPMFMGRPTLSRPTVVGHADVLDAWLGAVARPADDRENMAVGPGANRAIDWNSITTGTNSITNNATGIIRATAADADVTAKTLRLFDPKGNRKQPRPHILPLPEPALVVVKRCIARVELQRGLVEGDRQFRAGLVDTTDQLGVPAKVGKHPAGVDALGAEGDEQVLAHGES